LIYGHLSQQCFVKNYPLISFFARGCSNNNNDYIHKGVGRKTSRGKGATEKRPKIAEKTEK